MRTARRPSSDQRGADTSRTPDAASADRGVLPGTRVADPELVDAATAGDADALERLRSHYIEQLHERSDDFAATESLRIVEAALTGLRSDDDDIWEWQEREARREQERLRRRARRWWRRGR